MDKNVTKRIFTFLMAVLCFFVVGCGNKEPILSGEVNEPDETEGDVQPETTKELIKIGFSQVGHESDWRMASTTSAYEVFSEENGYDFIFHDADNDEAEQLGAVRNFIEQQVDYIIIDPIVTTGWDGVLREVKAAEIPVFIIDRMVDCDDDLYVAWFGTDFVREGMASGAWLEAYLDEKGRGDEEINIVTIMGSVGSSAQIGRSQGFKSYLKKNPNWKMLDEQDGMFTQFGGQQVMESFLKTYDDIDVVICQNDNEAWGAMDAMQSAGKSFGREGDIIVISYDSVHDALQDVYEGKINASFECNPLSAPFVADAIQTLENGGRILTKMNHIPESCFQAENNVESIIVGEELIKMITVTEDVLSSRAY